MRLHALFKTVYIVRLVNMRWQLIPTRWVLMHKMTSYQTSAYWCEWIKAYSHFVSAEPVVGYVFAQYQSYTLGLLPERLVIHIEESCILSYILQ